MKEEAAARAGPSWLLVRVVAFSGLADGLFGYDTGVVSGALVAMADDMDLSTFQQEVVVSSTVLLSAAGALLCIPISEWLGRRAVLLSAAVLYFAGALAVALSASFAVLLLGRVLLGIAVGFSSATATVYAAELSPSDVRGAVVTIGDFSIVAGQLAAGLMNGLTVHLAIGWRIASGLAAPIAALMLAGFIYLPESPRWLVQHGEIERAATVVRAVGGSANSDAEIAEIAKAVDAERSSGGGCGSLRALWGEKRLRRAAILGVTLMAAQQFSGINTIMYYSATVLIRAGFDRAAAVWIAALCCAAQLVGVVISICSVDTIGR